MNARSGGAGPANDRLLEASSLVSLAAVVWDFPLVGRTRMLAEAWQAMGVAHTFVQIPSYRTALQKVLAPVRPREAVNVVRPWPGPPSRTWPRHSRANLIAKIHKRADGLRRELDRHIDWKRAVAIVVTPSWAPWLDKLPFARVVYDCIDDLQVHVSRPELHDLFQAWEADLIARCDAAVVTADDLAESLRARRPDLPLAVIRNGVDAASFQEQAASSARPADLPLGDRPIVGFVGALYRWIDWELIGHVVREMPDCEFVLVGPDQGAPQMRTLRTLPNVHLLGARPYAQVPAYLNAFDVCWVPFTQDDISRAANPVKIYEYLALGKGVISTPVADTGLFEGHVQVGRTAPEICALLRREIACSSDPMLRAARRAFAERNTWSARASEFAMFTNNLLRGSRPMVCGGQGQMQAPGQPQTAID